MNSPEAQKWKITDEEYLCLGCKRHHLESKIHELQSQIPIPPTAPPVLPPCDEVVQIVEIVNTVQDTVKVCNILNIDNSTVMEVPPTAQQIIKECPVCDKTVFRGIICNGTCNTKYHISCVGINREQGTLISSGARSWCCHRGACMDKTPSHEDALGGDEFELTATWGKYTGPELVNVINNGYLEVVKWRRNLFQLPTGDVGNRFIEEVTKVLRMFNCGSDLEPIALTMLMLMFPLLLQKPAPGSKVKTHIKYLEKRLTWWTEGKIELLFDECRAVQSRLSETKSTPQDNVKAFTRLMLQGKVSAALRFIGSQQSSLLDVTETVLKDLKALHPPSVQPEPDALVKGPLPRELSQVVIFENIDSKLIYNCAKKSSGSAGPSGADAEMWQRMLCSKQFRTRPAELCEAVAELARKLCVSDTKPSYLRAFIAGRLIPLAKKPSGVRPIGVGEILRRIVGKAVTSVLKPELVNSTAPIQTCAGISGGIEASIHAMRRIYEDPATEGILLIDASNAFNSLNRKAALNNIKYTCPEFSCYINNLYRGDAELFVANSEETVRSCEGTTQGGSESGGFYACGTVPIVDKDVSYSTSEQERTNKFAKKIWYADDGGGGGSLDQLLTWWQDVQKSGPLFGYFPKASKTWLIVKPGKLERAQKMFPGINVTDQGYKYLGSYIGSEAGQAQYVNTLVNEWIEDVNALAKIAKTEPQCAYSAYVYGMSKRWAFICRTTPDVNQQMRRLGHHISLTLIPAIVGKDHITDQMRLIFSMPAKYGGLGILEPESVCSLEYESSIKATCQLTNAIFSQQQILKIDEEAQQDTMKEVKQKKDAWSKSLHDRIRSEASESQAKIIDLASEKGASSWLTSLPLAKYGFALNKQMFQDGICLRYNFALKLVARTCVCGELYTVNHCMTCKKGGYVILRHNSLRDLFAEILEEVCSDVQIEPPLLPLTGEKLPHGSNTAPGARLDVSARNLWSPLAKAFIDVRIFNPQAKTNWDRSIPQMYTSHENEKKTEYLPRVLQVEKATFTPAVFSTSGGIGKEADKLIRRMAERMSAKRGETYSSVVSFLRRRFRFDLLKTCIIALRGYKKPSSTPAKIETLDMDLRGIATSC